MNNNSNTLINNNCRILLFKIPLGTRENFFYIYKKFGHARLKKLTSPTVGSGGRCVLIQYVPQ